MYKAKILIYILTIMIGIFCFSTNRVLAVCDTNSFNGGVDCAGQNMTAKDLSGQGGVVAKVVNILFTIAGIAAVIAIIVGGVRYILSQGNEKSIEGAKNTVLYAVVGLIIVVLAFAIVNFVLTSL